MEANLVSNSTETDKENVDTYTQQNFLKILFFIFVCMGIMLACICMHHMCACAPKDQKKVPDPPELQLQGVGSHLMGATGDNLIK